MKELPRVFVYGMPGLPYEEVSTRISGLGWNSGLFPSSFNLVDINSEVINAKVGHLVSLFVRYLAVSHPGSFFIHLRPKSMESWIAEARSQIRFTNKSNALNQIFASMFLRGNLDYDRWGLIHGQLEILKLHNKLTRFFSVSNKTGKTLSLCVDDGLNQLDQFLHSNPRLP